MWLVMKNHKLQTNFTALVQQQTKKWLWDAKLQFQNSFYPAVTKRLVYGTHHRYIHGFESLLLLHRILYLDFCFKAIFNEPNLHVPTMNTHKFGTKHFYMLTITDMGEWRYSSTIPDLSTKWRWVASFTSQPIYPWGKSPCYSLRPQSWSGCSGEKKISCNLLLYLPSYPAPWIWGRSETLNLALYLKNMMCSETVLKWIMSRMGH
jgi:hypothetical protein